MGRVSGLGIIYRVGREGRGVSHTCYDFEGTLYNIYIYIDIYIYILHASRDSHSDFPQTFVNCMCMASRYLRDILFTTDTALTPLLLAWASF